MNHRERFHAVLNYGNYDRMPLIHFGFWRKTLEKWAAQGHISPELAAGFSDNSPQDLEITKMLGFDYNYQSMVSDKSVEQIGQLYPPFEEKVIESMPDGSQKYLTFYGVVELRVPGIQSIHSEIDWLFKDRKTWEDLFAPRLHYSPERIDWDLLEDVKKKSKLREYPLGLNCGSLYGQLRTMLGLLNLSYITVDDPELYDEMIDTIGKLCYDKSYAMLSSGAEFDFAHFWEDICFKNGSLIRPEIFAEKVGPWYKKITDMAKGFGISVFSVDCDGMIDDLVPVWLNNGVNTMFPIEVGTWNGSIAKWRDKYGRKLLGVGGVKKHVLAESRQAIDDEIERIRVLTELGGYIPNFDHRIAPDAEWDLVLYYADRFRKVFG